MFYLENHEMNMNNKISEVEKFWLDKDEDVVGVEVEEPFFEAYIIGVDGGKQWFDPIQSIERLDDGLLEIDYYYNKQILQLKDIERMVINLIYPVTIHYKAEPVYQFGSEVLEEWEYEDYHDFEYMVLIGE